MIAEDGDVQVEVACVFDLVSPPGWAELDPDGQMALVAYLMLTEGES